MGSVSAGKAARMPAHHLDEALLLDYAAGACGEAEALVIASHLTLCPDCRERLAEAESLGGALLEDLPPAELEAGGLERLMARLDEPEAAPADPAPRVQPQVGGGPILAPAPLRDYLAGFSGDFAALDWRSVTRGIDEVPLATADGAKAKLLRIRAGTKVPAHTHRGSEITLVLAGGFADSRGHFLRGDVAVSDQEVDHSPVADDDGDCICLVVTDAPLKLTGRLGRFLNPFVRF
jgi:putative transcriptional regulator